MRFCHGMIFMDTHSTILSLQDIRTLRQLLKITAIRGIYLNKKEIDTIFPDQDKVEIDSVGHLNFDSREIAVKLPGKKKRIVFFFLDDIPSMQPPDEYENYEDWHYSTQINLLMQLLGEETTLNKLADAMTRKYESLSTGQAKSVIMKFIPTFREDSSFMSSTTRTHIHRLRQKLEKYKRLVDSFYPLLIMENITLEDIAERMEPHQLFTQTPTFDYKAYPEHYDVNKIKGIVKEVTSPIQLRPAIRHSNEESSAEIEETKRKLREKGWDPDKIDQDELESENSSK